VATFFFSMSQQTILMLKLLAHLKTHFEFPGCAVVISHDRWFLDRVATHILAYEGDSKWFWFEGNFESYEANKIERLGPEAARPHRATYRKLTR
jgi:ATPase subunit of ABC transporter with duplicated ATPase domains